MPPFSIGAHSSTGGGDVYGTPLKSDSAPERPTADSRESSEKRRDNQHRKQCVSFLAEACPDLSTIRMLKAVSLMDLSRVITELGRRLVPQNTLEQKLSSYITSCVNNY